MTTTLRIDEGLKRDCEVVFEDLGLNMTSAITLFLRQVVKQRGIPFVATRERRRLADDLPRLRLLERGRTAKRFFAEMRSKSEKELSLDEINAEIAATRATRRARTKALSWSMPSSTRMSLSRPCVLDTRIQRRCA